MTRDEAERLLNEYRGNAARVAVLDAKIEAKREAIEILSRRMVEDSVVITQALSDMPRGTTPGDPTGRLAAALADGGESRPVQEAREELIALQLERAKTRESVSTVDAWMLALLPRERFVIRRHVLEGGFWRDVEREFPSAFGGESYSRKGLMNINRGALEKIFQIATEGEHTARTAPEGQKGTDKCFR